MSKTYQGKYDQKFDERAYKLCLLGLKDDELALAFGVAQSTITLWKREHPTFKRATDIGKREADGKVAEALYHKAIGYSHKDTHISVIKNKVVKTPITKHYPPDTSACIFWLKNRTRGQEVPWSDRLEVTGAEGRPLLNASQIDLSDLSDSELALLKSLSESLHQSTEMRRNTKVKKQKQKELN